MEPSNKGAESKLLEIWKTTSRLARDTRIPAATKGVFATLVSYANNYSAKCYPKHATLQENTGIKSKTTLIKHLNLLCEMGYIAIKSGKSANTTNVYEILVNEEGRGATAERGDTSVQGALGRKKMDTKGSNISSVGVQNLDTELTYELTKTELSCARGAASDRTTPKASFSQQGRGEREDYSYDDEKGPISSEASPPSSVDATALKRGQQINNALKRNHHSADPQILASARAFLKKYSQQSADRPLEPSEVMEFMRSGRWTLPTNQVLEDLCDDLIASMNADEFRAACKEVRRSYKHFWRRPPVFDTFVQASKKAKSEKKFERGIPAELIEGLKLNVRMCEMYS